MKNIGKGKKAWIGIYQIKCKGNNQIYIGSTRNIQERWRQHIAHLRSNKHHSIYLQRSFNKYGEDSFEFTVLLRMFDYNEELLRLNEWYYIEQYKPKFNISSPVLYENTEEWRKKISESTKKLYTEKGYINPRKGVGRKLNVLNSEGKQIAYHKDILEVCEIIGYKIESYRNINTYLRKRNGIIYLSTKNVYIYLATIPIETVIQQFSELQHMQINAVL